MRTHKTAAAIVFVLAIAVAAYASPIFGTWQGDLNGRPITVTVTYSNGHPDVAMTSDARLLSVSNAAFPKGASPLMIRFQAANQSGKAKLISTAGDDLSFELETADGRSGTLRVMDGGKPIATVKMTKLAAAK